ncbi:trigger factor [Aquimarina agarilytica]|uniref:trigger factor n=1 Tax=Aquimarina agarilytica TaxID=1087449 RepID=UPI00028A1AFD|nr:trigger factor [Aquimarina agarilytica]
MNISKEQIDDLNAVVTVNIEKEDYSDRVEKILKDYRKNANIPGFRKGHVPMGMVKKQYGQAVLVDEINKLIQETLNNYLTEEKLDVLGNPLPKEQADFSWDAEKFTFEFELGLAPKFDINLQGKDAIKQYKIVATEEMIDNQVTSIQKQYGKLTPVDVVANDNVVAGLFENEEASISKQASVELDSLQEKTKEQFIGAKVNDVITVNTKDLFENKQLLVSQVGVAQDQIDAIDVDVTFTISEVNERILADLDQELFDKLFGEKNVTSVSELKEKIKEDAENQFAQQADQQLLNTVTESVIENTTFDLPADFLKKWLQVSGEKQLTAEEAAAEYEKSEKGLRFQLIEGKIITDNKLQITYDEIKDHAKELIKGQMAQFGQTNPEDKELEEISGRILGNQDEVKRISEQLMSQKLLAFYKENAKLEEKEITFDDFIKEVYN